MLAIQSGIAKYHCLYAQRAVGSQTPGVFFDSPGTKSDEKRHVLLTLPHSRFGLTILCCIQNHVEFIVCTTTCKGTAIEIRSTRSFNAIPATLMRGIFNL